MDPWRGMVVTLRIDEVVASYGKVGNVLDLRLSRSYRNG